MNDSDKTLEKIFEDFNPELRSGVDFMEQLNRKLDAVEYIKQRQERQIRHYKYAVFAALILGLISGAIVFAFMLAIPESKPLFSFNSQSMILTLLAKNCRMILLITIATLMSWGIITVLNMVQGLKDENLDYKSKPIGS